MMHRAAASCRMDVHRRERHASEGSAAWSTGKVGA
jgi:hypothetical protein